MRERRTIVLTILLPVLVVIVVGTTFSLGYQEFESKELSIGVIGHRNSSYSNMLVEAIRNQSARAVLYESVAEAREDLVAEEVDTIIEVDPEIDEKMREFKRSWMAIHADETRPLLTAAIEVVMFQAKQQAVDEMAWEYVETARKDLIPPIIDLLDIIDRLVSGEKLEENINSTLDKLGPVVPIRQEEVSLAASVVELRFEEMSKGSQEQQLLLSMINRSAIVGAFRALEESKPLLDGAYYFLKYIQPNVSRLEGIPTKAAGDIGDLTGNLSQISPEQAGLIEAFLPMMRDDLMDALAEASPESSPEDIEERTEVIIEGASAFLSTVAESKEQLANLTSGIRKLEAELKSMDTAELYDEARTFLESAQGMDGWFLTSPIYLVEKPLYFGSETKRYVDYISPGIFAFGILFSVLVYTVLSVVRDREKGILRRIFICNVDRWTYVAGKCIVCLGVAAIQILVLTGCALLLFDIYIANIPKTLVFGLFSSIGFVGVGLLISSISKTELEALTWSFGFCFIMLLVSGIFYPFELSPSIVRQASGLVPITYVSDLLKAGMIKNSTIAEAAPDLISVGIYGGISLLIGTLAFNWRKKG